MIIKPSRHFEGSELIFPTTSIAESRRIAESLLTQIQWTSDDEGFCRCPGEHLHTHRNGTKDCKVFLRSPITITCFHSSCREAVTDANSRLRSTVNTISSSLGEKPPLTEEQKNQIEKARIKEQLRIRCANGRKRLLEDFRWPYAKIRSDSPATISENAADHWKVLLGIFDPDDVVWIGNKYDSSKPHHSRHFRKVMEWATQPCAPAQFTCGSTFREESFARTNENVVNRRHLIVESDELDRDTVGAIFRWLRDNVGLELKCVVDTAGKSLHGWFEFPNAELFDELRVALPEFGCDPKMFTASQPCRLPGARRDQGFQRLIYLSREAV
jgi:hypothetical protein